MFTHRANCDATSFELVVITAVCGRVCTCTQELCYAFSDGARFQAYLQWGVYPNSDCKLTPLYKSAKAPARSPTAPAQVCETCEGTESER